MNTAKLVLVPMEKYQNLISNVNTHESHEIIDIHHSNDDIELIVKILPKLYRNKARALLAYIQKSKVLNWLENGELVFEGKTIHNSHISDLIKYSMKLYKNFKPKGYEEFYLGLAKINIPEGILGNEELKDGVRELKEDDTHTECEWINL